MASKNGPEKQPCNNNNINNAKNQFKNQKTNEKSSYMILLHNEISSASLPACVQEMIYHLNH